MDGVDRVSIPLCRYEELIDIETRVQILVERLDDKEPVPEEEIWLILGYVNKYRNIKGKKRIEHEKFLKEVFGGCQESKSATKNTETEKESVAQT